MGYLVKAGIGLALFFGAIIVFNLKLVELWETGTCASGNTAFEIARPCPEGAGTNILLVTASVFAGLIGAALFAFRGDPPWAGRRSSGGLFGLGALAWGIFFTATGATMLYTAWANDTIGADGELAGMIVGITFLVMGAPVLLLAPWISARGLSSPRDEMPAMVGGSPSKSTNGGLPRAQAAQQIGRRLSLASGPDAIEKLERLQRLRESGAITDAEFEREKAKILAE